jgi:hypothetical protein
MLLQAKGQQRTCAPEDIRSLEREVVTHRSHGDAPQPSAARARAYFSAEPVTECTLRIGADGSVYVGITAASPGPSGGFLLTRDNGRHWTHVIPTLPGEQDLVLNAAMGSIAIDPLTQRIFASSMGDPSCAVEGEWAEKIARLVRSRKTWSDTLAYSDDSGASWTVVRGQFRDAGDWGKTFLGPPARAATRERLARSGYPNVIYHSAGATFSCTSYCFRSFDGGATFERTARPVFCDYRGRTPLPYGEPPAELGGAPRDDQHTLSGVGVVANDGTIYIPANINGFARIYVSWDEGDSWTDRPVPVAAVRGKHSYGDITGFQQPPNGGRPIRPQQPFHALYGSTAMSSLWSQQLAIDTEGTLYLSWVSARDDLPYLSISRDGAKSWSEPLCVAAPGVNMACISAIVVDRPGQVAIAYYASRDGGETFDGMLSVSHDVHEPSPSWISVQTSPEAPIQPNRISEPIEFVGVSFAPDGSVWAAFARDTAIFDESSAERQCDGNFRYNGDRFKAVVLRLDATG